MGVVSIMGVVSAVGAGVSRSVLCGVGVPFIMSSNVFRCSTSDCRAVNVCMSFFQ